MRSLFVLAAGTVAVLSTASGPVHAGAPGQQTATGAPTPQRTLLDRYCVTCHNARLQTAGLALDRVDLARWR